MKFICNPCNQELKITTDGTWKSGVCSYCGLKQYVLEVEQDDNNSEMPDFLRGLFNP